MVGTQQARIAPVGASNAAAELAAPGFLVLEGGLGRDLPRTRPVRRARPRSVAPDVALAVVGLLFVAAVTLVALGIDSFLAGSRDAAWDAVEHESIVVSAGDSLWSIAEERTVEGLGTADLVRLIERENGLEAAMLSPGDELVVPVVG